jgi:hypothetical protein
VYRDREGGGQVDGGTRVPIDGGQRHGRTHTIARSKEDDNRETERARDVSETERCVRVSRGARGLSRSRYAPRGVAEWATWALGQPTAGICSDQFPSLLATESCRCRPNRLRRLSSKTQSSCQTGPGPTYICVGLG